MICAKEKKNGLFHVFIKWSKNINLFMFKELGAFWYFIFFVKGLLMAIKQKLLQGMSL